MTFFVHLGLGFFLFCLSDCIQKRKIAKKRAKGRSRGIVQEEKIIAGRHSVLEVKDHSHLLGIFSRM